MRVEASPEPATDAAVADVTESELIDRIRRCLPPAPGWMTVGIGDDAAVVEPERNRLDVLTVDALVEGIHFDRRFTPAAAIGHRALAVNLSDLAAMGATPRLALVSLVLPPSLSLSDFDGLVSGLTALAARYRMHIAGGNITRSPNPLIVDVTVMGTVKRRRALTRAGARPGDQLYVSGTLGTAAAGLGAIRATNNLAASSEPTMTATVGRYLFPEPRVRLGSLLARNRAATACIDLSDGLADAVRQIGDASGVGVALDADAIPIDPLTRVWFEQRGIDPINAAIAGGDDYELLFASCPRQRSRLAAAEQHGDVPLTRIGVCTPGRELTVRRATGGRPVENSLPPPGFAHFR